MSPSTRAALLLGLALSAAQPAGASPQPECGAPPAAEVDEEVEELKKVNLLQMNPPVVVSAEPLPSVAPPGGTEQREAEGARRLRGFERLWAMLNETQRAALVPKDLQPLSAEELRALGAKNLDELEPGTALDELEPALLAVGSNGTQSPVYPFGAFCGSSTRFDVAALQGGPLTFQQCFIFSCVAPFISSSTCGPYFYTNGQGNCKCCDYGSNLYYSTASPPNYLFSCR